MKKFYLLALLAIISLAANAQLYVGGSVGAWRGSNDDGNLTTTINILPEVGYNLNEKLAVGTTIGWEYSHVTGLDVNVFQLFPYARYTFVKLGIVNLFCDGTAGFGAGKANYDDEYFDDDNDAACIWAIGLKPGISVNINDKCSIVAHVGFFGYQGANNAAKDVGYSDQWGLRLSGNDLKLSFYYTF
ncbi:MAG: outer membrane beta-barrel protein [Muribaculaceae bacterium]|nr:outer membrane beta-barrel protein [Muribaculaceae bacterium]